MLLKILGAVLVIGAALLLGYQGRLGLAAHVRQLGQLREMLLLLNSDMTFNRTTLEEAFESLAERTKSPFSEFCRDFAESVRERKGQPFVQLWKEQVHEYRKEFCFSEEETEILEELGAQLEQRDLQLLSGKILYCARQMEQRMLQAREELEKKQKLYQVVSLVCGLFLVLVLL